MRIVISDNGCIQLIHQGERLILGGITILHVLIQIDGCLVICSDGIICNIGIAVTEVFQSGIKTVIIPNPSVSAIVISGVYCAMGRFIRSIVVILQKSRGVLPGNHPTVEASVLGEYNIRPTLVSDALQARVGQRIFMMIIRMVSVIPRVCGPSFRNHSRFVIIIIQISIRQICQIHPMILNCSVGRKLSIGYIIAI